MPSRLPEPDPLDVPGIALLAKRADAAWYTLFKSAEGAEPDDAAEALREYQSLLDDGFFAKYFEVAPERFKNTLRTLREFKDDLAQDASNAAAAGRSATVISAVVGLVTAGTNEWEKATARTTWWGIGAGVAMIVVGLFWLRFTERRAARWAYVLRDYDAVLSDIRKQGPGK